jgi:DNA invertase Pin-like site-specific DNA recombinase
MLIGYARVSTHDQTLTIQQKALETAGCSKIFTDTVSDPKAKRKRVVWPTQFWNGFFARMCAHREA